MHVSAQVDSFMHVSAQVDIPARVDMYRLARRSTCNAPAHIFGKVHCILVATDEPAQRWECSEFIAHTEPASHCACFNACCGATRLPPQEEGALCVRLRVQPFQHTRQPLSALLLRLHLLPAEDAL